MGFFDDLFGDIGGLGGIGSALQGVAAIGSVVAPLIAGGRQADAASDAIESTNANNERILAFLANRDQQSRADIAAANQQTRSDIAPFRTTGLLANYAIADLLGASRPNYLPDSDTPIGGITPTSGFQQTPGYQFVQDEAQRRALSALSARGQRWSGRPVVEAVGDRAAGLASNEFGNYFARLQALANQGESSTQAGINSATSNLSGSLSAGTANANQGASALAGNQSNILSGFTGLGNARASSIQAPINALTGLVNNQNAASLVRQLTGQGSGTGASSFDFGGAGSFGLPQLDGGEFFSTGGAF